MKEVRVNATRDQIEDFMGSVLWNDIVTELEAWKQGFALEQDSIVDDAASENPSTATVLMHIGDLNGRKKAVDYFLSLPEVFLSILEGQKNDSRHEQAD